MFLVKTLAAKPYIVLLAISMTSLVSLNLMIHWTGPKICNISFESDVYFGILEYLFAPNAHIWFDIREERGFDKVSLCSNSVASTLESGSFAAATLDEVHDFVQLLL
jgi:hypothetical protein